MDPAEPANQAQSESAPDSLVDSAMQALRGALEVAEASLTLLRAELRLARSSALSIVWLGFALVFFGVGAWLATTFGLALAIHALSGSLLLGVGTVAAANLAGAAWVLHSMRRCWRDMSLPRTRALLVSPRSAESRNAVAVRDSDESGAST
ncbi:hypothetical protein [Dokdonella sp.]|uniref:hypothetical protein n=1 Tax=Dokdonella sp. TaxID=2291710 RepID=UPI003527C54A